MEGIVKFNCYWSQSGPVVSDEQYETINNWRDVLYNMDLIGSSENGINYGNISMRIKGSPQFVISGASTGELTELNPGHYTRISSVNFDENAVQCIGPVKAPAETLLHAAVYLADRGVNAVVHIHCQQLWDDLINKVPTTAEGMDYKTPGLAMDILRLFGEPEVIEKRIIVLAGERGGILSFGNDMDEAVNILMEYLKK